MKKLATLALTAASTLLLTFAYSFSASTAYRRPCSCTAPDNSCSVSASCLGGCTAMCPSGACTAYCGGYYAFLEREVTLQFENGTYKQLLESLSNASGREVSFSAPRADAALSLDIKSAPLWDVLDGLSARGTVMVGGQDFENLKALRSALVSGDKISLCAQEMPVSTLVRDISNLSGRPIRIADGNTKATVNVKLQGVTLEEILTKVSDQTGTKITDESAAPAQ